MAIFDHYMFRWMIPDFLLEIKVRLSIFSIIGVSAGLPALVWSVDELIEHRKNGLRISFFIILLLLTDFAELFLTPYIFIKFLSNEMGGNMGLIFWVFWDLWWSLRVCGLLLNQLVALEGILSVRYPLYTAAVFSSACFRIFYILVFLCILCCKMLWLDLMIVLCIVLFALASLIVSMISCRASCSSERHSHTSRKPDQHLWVIFILTLLVLYLPLILHLFSVFTFSTHDYFCHIIFNLMSVRPWSDPLLCVLVCRQNLHLQTSQNPEENVDQSDELVEISLFS